MNTKQYNDWQTERAQKRRARMVMWRERGYTLKAIGEKFGITRQKVYWHLKRWVADGGKINARK